MLSDLQRHTVQGDIHNNVQQIRFAHTLIIQVEHPAPDALRSVRTLAYHHRDHINDAQ